MTELKDLHIFIIDCSPTRVAALTEYFNGVKNVEVEEGDIKAFVSNHIKDIDCLVSPANAFGLMTGGYDAALSDILGWSFQKKVQQYIKDHYYGEQPVGSSFIIDTGMENLSLIHTPTMRYPSAIKDPMVVYNCMRSTLMCALKNDVKSIVVPIFGGFYGEVKPMVIGKLMRAAYDQIAEKKGPVRYF